MGSELLSPEYIQQLYAYHYWANRRVLAAAEKLTDEQLHMAQPCSWGSVLRLLVHMRNAEWVWLQRWQGANPETFPDFERYPTLEALRLDWAEVEGEMLAFIAAQSPQSLLSKIAYTSTRGDSYVLELWQMMVHVANHGAHHRGELAVIFAAMDVPHQEEDWLHYFLSQGGQRST